MIERREQGRGRRKRVRRVGRCCMLRGADSGAAFRRSPAVPPVMDHCVREAAAVALHLPDVDRFLSLAGMRHPPPLRAGRSSAGCSLRRKGACPRPCDPPNFPYALGMALGKQKGFTAFRRKPSNCRGVPKGIGALSAARQFPGRTLNPLGTCNKCSTRHQRTQRGVAASLDSLAAQASARLVDAHAGFGISQPSRCALKTKRSTIRAVMMLLLSGSKRLRQTIQAASEWGAVVKGGWHDASFSSLVSQLEHPALKSPQKDIHDRQKTEKAAWHNANMGPIRPGRRG